MVVFVCLWVVGVLVLGYVVFSKIGIWIWDLLLDFGKKIILLSMIDGGIKKIRREMIEATVDEIG